MTGVEVVATVLGVVLTLCALIGIAWRFVVLPNLREQLFQPVEETRRQVVENKHVSVPPTLVDQLHSLADDVRDLTVTVDAIGISQAAVLRVANKVQRIEKNLGEHVEEATTDRKRIWLLLESLTHEENLQQKGKRSESDQGGA